MARAHTIHAIANIHNDYHEKFGIPRQSGLVDSVLSAIVFTPAYRSPEALRGLEGFSHLWLIWQFSQSLREGWSPTVRPPRLGGNTRMGVFATRSPFRPNALGLSCVALDFIQWEGAQAPVLWVRGADLLNGTPIFDIKPYVPYADCHPEAKGGFALPAGEGTLNVVCDKETLAPLPKDKHQALLDVLAQDPRPGYQHTDGRVYALAFAGFDVGFTVEGDTVKVLTVRRKGLR